MLKWGILVLLVAPIASEVFEASRKDVDFFRSAAKEDGGRIKQQQLMVLVSLGVCSLLGLLTAVWGWILITDVYLKVSS